MKKSIIYSIFIAVLGLAVTLGGVPSALADDIYCPPNLSDTTVDGDLIVDGACTITNVTIKGNVIVEPQGDFRARGGSIIEGNIEADGAIRVRVLGGSMVKGNVELKNLTGGVDGGKGSDFFNSSIFGNLEAEENEVRFRVCNMSINGNAEIFNNDDSRPAAPDIVSCPSVGNPCNVSGVCPNGFGNICVVNNTIAGNLECEDNFPDPDGCGNTVSGNKEGQCAAAFGF